MSCSVRARFVSALLSDKVGGRSMWALQDRHLVLKAVMMACCRRADRAPMILHSERGV